MSRSIKFIIRRLFWLLPALNYPVGTLIASAGSCDCDVPIVKVDQASPFQSDAYQQVKVLFGALHPWENFFNSLKTSALESDVGKLGELVDYPLSVNAVNGHFLVAGPDDFAERFAELFDEKLLSIIEHQAFEDLIVNYQGCAFGSGELWFSEVELPESEATGPSGIVQIRIIAINKLDTIHRGNRP